MIITKSVTLAEQAQRYLKQFEFQKANAAMSQLISSLTDNQNADIVKPVTISHEQSNNPMLEALLKIAKRLEAGQTDEWTIAALARIAREALNKSTEEI